MQEYAGKDTFIDEIRQSSLLYLQEFAGILEADKNLRLEDVEKTPYENLASQLGWITLLKKWESDERDGIEVTIPAPGIKWNQLAQLHQQFYSEYKKNTLLELQLMYQAAINELCAWINTLSDEELFHAGGRRWSQASASNRPVWKWVHINTVASCKALIFSIRKWKKIRADMEQLPPKGMDTTIR